MKKIATGDYSFKLKEPIRVTEFLPDEEVNILSKESHDRSSVSVINTLDTVKKLDKLFFDITNRK